MMEELTTRPIRMYNWHYNRLGPQISQEEARSVVQSLVEKGCPLFTREALQEVGQQLKRAYKGEIQTINVKSLDGVTVEFPIETGQVQDGPQPGTEFIVGQPAIMYMSEQLLLSPVSRPTNRSCCNLRIVHYRTLRNSSTKELLGVCPVKSQENAHEFFQIRLQQWKTSQAYQQLKSYIMSTTSVITKIIGFAFGSIALNNVEADYAFRSAFQHALLVTLKDIFCQKLGTEKIACYVQDPLYTNCDRQLLGSHRINVLDDPDGLIEVNNSTLVISCAPNVPIRQIVTDIAQPAIMIWSRVNHKNDQYSGTDPTSPRLRKMVSDHYDEMEFTGDEEYFGNLAVYIRRT